MGLGHLTSNNWRLLFSSPFSKSPYSTQSFDLAGNLAMDLDHELIYECPGEIRIYKSGRVERFAGTEIAPPSLDEATGVTSRDVDIDAGVSARLFLPDLSKVSKDKLPVLVYYHGGGFCWQSPFTAYYSRYLYSLVAAANVVAVSVDYRLAPENQLPAAYHDSFAALRWVASHAGGGGGEDPWLAQHGDFDRVFLAGDSAGGNIVHNVLLMAGRDGLGSSARIRGAALVHPFFWSRTPEGTEDEAFRRSVETLWRLAYRETTGMDDPAINPFSEGAPSLRDLPCGRVLVAVAEKDALAERGRIYYRGIKGSRWNGEAELFETEGESHVFHLFHPDTDKAAAFLDRVTAFLNQ